MAVAYLLDPACDRLEKWGCSRTLATALVTAVFVLVAILTFVGIFLYGMFLGAGGVLTPLPSPSPIVVPSPSAEPSALTRHRTQHLTRHRSQHHARHLTGGLPSMSGLPRHSPAGV